MEGDKTPTLLVNMILGAVLALHEDLHPPLLSGGELACVQKNVECPTLQEMLDLASPLVVEVDRAHNNKGHGRDIVVLSMPLLGSCKD